MMRAQGRLRSHGIDTLGRRTHRGGTAVATVRCPSLSLSGRRSSHLALKVARADGGRRTLDR